MRLFLSPPEKHVAIIIDQNHLTCAWLEQPSSRAPFTIKAYAKKELAAPNSSECLFAPTDIGATVSHFIKKQMPPNSFKQTLISSAFASPLIYERLAAISQGTPSPTDLHTYQSLHASAPDSATHTYRAHPKAPDVSSRLNSDNTAWDYNYLYPTETHESVYYVCGIVQPLLLQYKLLALAHQLNLHITTSQTAALLQLYRYTHGAAFRASQLGVDMQRARNSPELLFSDEMIRRLITVPAHNSFIDKRTALTLAGLACTGIYVSAI